MSLLVTNFKKFVFEKCTSIQRMIEVFENSSISTENVFPSENRQPPSQCPYLKIESKKLNFQWF